MRHKDGTGTLDLMTGHLMVGYARVSTDDQDLTNQRAELHAAGCSRIFSEKITGTHSNREELARMLDHLRPGDVAMRRELMSQSYTTRLDQLWQVNCT